MVLRKLELQNFRLFSQIDLSFSDGINLITGKNGQGKTSILEAIHYLALTKSFRTSKDKNAVKYKQSFLNIRGNIISVTSQQNNIRFFYSSQDSKQIFVNEKRVKKFSEYIGTIPCVILTLDDLRLSSGSPSERRRFFNILLSQVSPVYLENLKNYRKSVQQRSALLTDKKPENIKNQIGIWNEQLVKYGIPIVKKRLDLIDFLNSHLSEKYQQYSGEKEVVRVKYKTNFITEEKMTKPDEELAEIFMKKLNENYDREIAFQTTLTGPHRDDIEFFKDNKSFKEYASQGENKTLIIVLKFLEWEYLSQNRHKNPVLLLDDIFGELDESRMNRLLEYLQHIGQAFITTTMDQKFSKEIVSRKFVIKEGNVFDA
jgi:DNA replication and repair protein RecF